jgi:hypothetical protein
MPENQRAGTSSFFDLIVASGQSQVIEIDIRNTSNDDIVVLVETITASTNRNGIINYSSEVEADESLKHPFSELATLPGRYFEIEAGQTKRVPISLKIPNEPISGIILGSVRVLREVTQAERDAGGAVVNQFASVTAVRIAGDISQDNIPADFALGEVEVDVINSRASIIAHVRNTQPKLIKNATATAQITHLDTDEIVFEHSQNNLEFAPNSAFPFSFIDNVGRGISAGDYRVLITVNYEGETWEFEHFFTIESQEADAINEAAIIIDETQVPLSGLANLLNIPTWAFMGIIIILLLIFLAIIILIVVLSRKKPILPKGT